MSNTCPACGAPLAPSEAGTTCLTCGWTAHPAPPPATAPDTEGTDGTVGDYNVVRSLGQGAIGLVYEAVHQTSGRRIALKLPWDIETASDDVIGRFLAQAREAAVLTHPDVVPIVEVGRDASEPWVGYHFVPGLLPITTWLSPRPDTAPGGAKRPILRGVVRNRRIAGLLARAARAVQAGHELGLLHGNLKPGNVLVDFRGHPRVTDFNLEPLETGATWRFVTTPDGLVTCYQPPEVFRGEPATTAADVFGLGCILYELLTGVPPFVAASAEEALDTLTVCTPPAPRQLQPGVDEYLEAICLRALTADPALRTTVTAFAEDLEEWLVTGSLLSGAPHPEPAAKGPSPVVLAGLFVFLGLGIATGWLWWKTSHGSWRPEPGPAAARVATDTEDASNATDQLPLWILAAPVEPLQPPLTTAPTSAALPTNPAPPAFAAEPVTNASPSPPAAQDPAQIPRQALEHTARSILPYTPSDPARALTQHALELAPDHPAVQLAGWVWNQRTGPSNLLTLPPAPPNRSAVSWENEGHGWTRSNRWTEASLAYTHALDQLAGVASATARAAQIRLFRAQALLKLGLAREAGLDNCRTRSLPLRTDLNPAHLDLSAYYNGRLNFALPTDRADADAAAPRAPGAAALGDVDFDVRGVVQLEATNAPAQRLPATVGPIRVGLKATRLHVLHAATQARTTARGLEIARYRLHFADGAWSDLPVLIGEQVLDASILSPAESLGPDSVPVRDPGAAPRAPSPWVQLYRTTWTVPHPDLLLESIEIVSSRNGPGLVVFAISVE